MLGIFKTFPTECEKRWSRRLLNHDSETNYKYKSKNNKSVNGKTLALDELAKEKNFL